jgi:transposase
VLSPTPSLEHEPADIAQLLARQALLEQAQREREQRIALLTEENRWLKQQLFGRSSEQRVVDDIAPDQQRLIFNEAEVLAPAVSPVDASITIPEHDRKKRGRKALPAQLPRIEIIHDLLEGEKVCPRVDCAGAALTVIGQETAEQLDYIPATVRVLKHIRLKYACPCCQQGVKVAARPAQLLPKSNATPSLLAHIVTAKYVDGTPLYRQEAQFKRLGIDLPRATQANWMLRLSEAVIPLINLMSEQCRAQPLIHMDETTVQVLNSHKAATTTHYMWVQAAGPPGHRLVLFDYDASRSAAVPKRLLQDYAGLLLTDGYEAYDAAIVGTAITHAACWAHVRRKFDEAAKASLSKDSQARIALDFIGQLYGVERDVKVLRTQREARGELVSNDEVLALRAQHSAPILEQFKVWLDAHVDHVLPQSALGKALYYTLNQWPKLTVFLSHAQLSLDNNRCENAIRPFVIGRKNWLFCDTQAGAIASARLYSLIETAKANGLEPHAYLTRLFTELPKATCLADFEALLPFKIKNDIRTP